MDKPSLTFTKHCTQGVPSETAVFVSRPAGQQGGQPIMAATGDWGTGLQMVYELTIEMLQTFIVL